MFLQYSVGVCSAEFLTISVRTIVFPETLLVHLSVPSILLMFYFNTSSIITDNFLFNFLSYPQSSLLKLQQAFILNAIFSKKQL